jgi:DNA repair protein RecO (recombination protein O)
MDRNFTYRVLTLRVRALGESNREAWFLSSEEGLIRATIFGGPKSKLRSQVSPFHSGRLWVYQDRAKDSRKVTDFEVLSWRPGIREVYERTMAADGVAEASLASPAGGGGWEQVLDLAEQSLDAIEKGDEKLCSPILLCFLWRWALLLGLEPPLDRCASCACEAPRDEVLWYNIQEGAAFCENCAGGGREGLMPLGPGTRAWLKAAGRAGPSQVHRYGLDGPGLRQAANLVTRILSEALGKRLNTWDYL